MKKQSKARVKILKFYEREPYSIWMTLPNSVVTETPDIAQDMIEHYFRWELKHHRKKLVLDRKMYKHQDPFTLRWTIEIDFITNKYGNQLNRPTLKRNIGPRSRKMRIPKL